jgi:hypothetical protein
MRFSKRIWLVISGIVWAAIGIMLLIKGIRFIVLTLETNELKSPILNSLMTIVGSRQKAGLLLISIALLFGFIKGRTVLGKAVKRVVKRIYYETEKLPISSVYDVRYYITILAMVGIGVLFRVLPIPLDIRGFIDVIIGSALINGAILYFREAYFPTIVT